MTAMLDVTPKTTEQNRIVRSGKSEAEVTNNKKTALEVLYVLLKLTTDRQEAPRGLFPIAELLLLFTAINAKTACDYHPLRLLLQGQVLFLDTSCMSLTICSSVLRHSI